MSGVPRRIFLVTFRQYKNQFLNLQNFKTDFLTIKTSFARKPLLKPLFLLVQTTFRIFSDLPAKFHQNLLGGNMRTRCSRSAPLVYTKKKTLISSRILIGWPGAFRERNTPSLGTSSATPLPQRCPEYPIVYYLWFYFKFYFNECLEHLSTEKNFILFYLPFDLTSNTK